MSNQATPDVGQIVAVWQRLYLVEQTIPPVNPGDSTLVQLSCVDDDAQGQTLDVLWDIEPDARAHESDRRHGLGTREFDDPALKMLDGALEKLIGLLRQPSEDPLALEEYQELIKNITSSRDKMMRRLVYDTFLRFFLGTITRLEWTDAPVLKPDLVSPSKPQQRRNKYGPQSIFQFSL